MLTVYLPMCWIYFGGSNLKHVTGILFQTDAPDAIYGIKIVYDDHISNDDSTTKLGRRTEYQNSYDTLFSIDGEGGERITSVHIGLGAEDYIETPALDKCASPVALSVRENFTTDIFPLK